MKRVTVKLTGPEWSAVRTAIRRGEYQSVSDLFRKGMYQLLKVTKHAKIVQARKIHVPRNADATAQ